MGLNEAASADRIQIGFFGMRNAGKSSLVNAVTGQELSLVSNIPGTTTDPVRKAMELLPLGPVVIIDTPGLDDEGALGELRVKRALQMLNLIDIAVLVVDAARGMSEGDRELLHQLHSRNIPHIVAFNKCELIEESEPAEDKHIYVSAECGINIDALKDKIASLTGSKQEKFIISDLLEPGDTVLLVIPIDEAAPKGRLILPQQQTMRDILDHGAKFIACRDSELSQTLDTLRQPPKMVITDSQVFGTVAQIVPESVPLTSFSILFARYKGNLTGAVQGAAMLDALDDGDKILISEGCTHHRQCGDIGSVKLPAWIRKHSGKELEFVYTSGRDFPDNVAEYKLIIHCGACMLTEREMQHRIHEAAYAGIPITNYGMAIAHTHGILRRSLELFPEALSCLDE